MKKTVFYPIFCMMTVIIITSCSRLDSPSSSSKSHFNVSALSGSPYFALLEKDAEIFGRYWYMDMHLFQDTAEDHHYMLHDEPLQYYPVNGSDQHITITDKCNMVNNGQETEFLLTRTIDMNNGNQFVLPYSCQSQNLKQLEIITPVVTKCDPIPSCYYSDLEVTWNADENNQNGMAIFVEWLGSTISGHTHSYVVNGDIVEDNGHTVLRNEIFDNIPNEALVNIWFMRANVITMEDKAPTELYDQLADMVNRSEYSQSQKLDIISTIRNKPLPVTFSGSVALLPIILIREL